MHWLRYLYYYDLPLVGDLLEMTYKIKSVRGAIYYNVEGIVTGMRNSQEQRRKLLLQIVSQNPRINHTHVIRIATEYGKIAKRTTEKELARMEEEGLLESKKLSGKANAIRMWQIPILEPSDDKKIKNDLDQFMLGVKEQISQTRKIYHTLSIEKKAELCSLLLLSLNSLQPMLITVGKIIEIEERKSTYQKLIEEVYSILMKDVEFPSVFSPFIKKVLPIGMKNMEELIKFIHTHNTKSFDQVTVLSINTRAKKFDVIENF